MKAKLISLIIVLVNTLFCFGQKKYTAEWESLDKRPIPNWFGESKFGIFIHWGVYAVPSWAPIGKEYDTYSKYSEWYWNRLVLDTSNVGRAFREHHLKTYGPNFKYQDFAPKFTAELFNPNQWADIIKSSGAKYVVLTSKHHEGFTLWPSAQSWNWNSVDIGPHRDLAGELSSAVKSKGLHMGFYYSLYEWFHPLYLTDVNKYVNEHMIPQMKDLVNSYKPDVLWTDGEWDHPSSTWRSPEFLAWLYNESPVKESIVVNDRWGNETRGKHGGFYVTEYDHGKEHIKNHPWEEGRGIGGSFGYSRAESLNEYNSSKELIRLLIEKVSNGGNLLLDIGPTADGRIPVIMQQRLKDIGDWLAINGEAIYGTTKWEGSPNSKGEQTVFYTKKGNDIYVLFTKWPEASLLIPGIRRIKSINLLGADVKIKTSVTRNGLQISPVSINPSHNPSQCAWVFKVTGVE